MTATTSTTFTCDAPGCPAAVTVDGYVDLPEGWARLTRADLTVIFHSWPCVVAAAGARVDPAGRLGDPDDLTAAGVGYRADVIRLAGRVDAGDADRLRLEAAGKGPVTLANPAAQAELDRIRQTWSPAVPVDPTEADR